MSSRSQGSALRATGPEPRAEGRTDAELLAAVATGSERAFEELSRRYRRAVDRLCSSLVGREAEDCAQEVFTRVWRKARLFDAGRGTAASWLFTLTRNVGYNVRLHRIPEPVADRADPGVEGGDGPVVERFWLEAAMERLAPMERTVIELAYYHDRSQREIARELGVPLGSVKSWTRRGLNRLATLLGEESEAP